MFSSTAEALDFVVFGKKGAGKSTTGNILIGAQNKKKSESIGALKATEKIQDIYNSSEETYFQCSGGVESCTQKCQVLSHGPIRVLDVPGFADSEGCSEASVWERNLALIRNAKRVQDELKLSFHRILYFLPQRGPLRRVDAYLKDELDSFYSFFGRVIFDNMIVIVTNDPSYQKTGFSDTDLKTTKDTLMAAVEKIWTKNKKAHPDASQPPNCPPVIYLPLGISTLDLLIKIKDTPVPMGTSSATLTIAQNVCTKCGWSVIRVNDDPFQVTNGKESVPFCESACHPKMIPQFTVIQKLLGGIAHLLTLELATVYEMITGKQSWPGFTNSDEICNNCKETPGRSQGCMKIYGNADTNKTYTVEHSFMQLSCEIRN